LVAVQELAVDVITHHDPTTGTLTHLVFEGADAVLIDPVLDFDAARDERSSSSLESLASVVAARKLHVHAVLETHVHADHLSGARWWKERFGAPILIGHRVREVQHTLRKAIGRPELAADGHQFDALVHDGDELAFGALRLRVLETPGHTPACVSFLAGDAVFTGDSLCNPDNGVGRCDFPGGDASAMYTSVVTRLFVLPPTTRVFPGHDYPQNGRGVRTWCTLDEHRRTNVQLRDGISREAFVEARTARDATLKPPTLFLPSLRANLEAGAR